MQSLTRSRIKLLLYAAPGIHLRGLQRALGMSFNSTRYHVEKLVKNGDVLRLDDKGYSRLYPSQIDAQDILLVTTIRNKTDRRILASLARAESMTNEQLRGITNLAKSTLSEHLTRLVILGIVKTSQRAGDPTVYSLIDPAHIRSLMEEQQSHLLDKATDRFIDLWDF